MKRNRSAIIFSIIYLTYMSVYVARISLSMASPALKSLGILDATQIGILGSCFFVVYAMGRMLNGTFSDSVPPSVMICSGLILSGVSTICFSFFPPFAAMCLFWILNAFGQSMLWSSILCTVAAIYDKAQEKRKVSLMVTSVATGNIAGILIHSWMLSRTSPRSAFLVPGILVICLAVAVYFSTKDIRGTAATPKKSRALLGMLKNKELQTINAVAIIHGVMKENISLWMAVYVVDTYFLDLTASSLYILLIPVIGFVGRLICPFLFRICGEKELRVSVLGFILCAAGSALLFSGRCGMLLSVLALGVIYMAVSFINTAIVSVYPMNFLESGTTASVSGLLDFSTYLGAGISSMVYGAVIAAFGYAPMFLSWAILSCISIFILIRLPAREMV